MKLTKQLISKIIYEELSLTEADTDKDGTLNPDELRDLADDLELSLIHI